MPKVMLTLLLGNKIQQHGHGGKKLGKREAPCREMFDISRETWPTPKNKTKSADSNKKNRKNYPFLSKRKAICSRFHNLKSFWYYRPPYKHLLSVQTMCKFVISIALLPHDSIHERYHDIALFM
jgi:hypothetical protein